MAHRWAQLVEIVGVNTVPIAGVYGADWSWATALAVYWWENLLGSGFVALRLWLHARWRDPHSVPDVAADSSFAPRHAGAFLATAGPFTLAHGLMLIGIFTTVLDDGPRGDHLRQAVVGVLAVQSAVFAWDLWSLADWPVERVNDLADYVSGRVVFVQLSVMAGMLTVAWFGRPEAFFGFFAGVKTLSDITRSLVPRVDQATPDAPPAWLSAIMRRVPKQGGETFDEHWRRVHRGEAPVRPDAPESGPSRDSSGSA